MTRKFFSGKSLDQVVMMAARHYELEPSELAYRQIEKKHGFLRTRKAVMIAVDPENPRMVPGAVASAAGSERGRDTEPEPLEDATDRSESGPAESEEPEARVADEDDAPDAWVADEPEERESPDSWAADEPEEAETQEIWVNEPGERDEVRAPEADEKAPEEAAPTARRPAYRESEPRDVTGDDELLDAAVQASETLLQFAGIEASATAKAAGERIEVEIEGPDESVLVVEGGKGLLSVQHLLPRMLRGLTGRSSFVRVDSEGFHQKRKERLEELALKEADAASRNRRPRTLPPMAPDERRIVHLALKDSPSVVTESRGSGLHKRVVIRPADGFDEPGDIEARHGF